MSYFFLPHQTSKESLVKFENLRSMVIVGANGSGKSRIGAKIQELAYERVHRISAQRALSIPKYVESKVYAEAESRLLYGAYDPQLQPAQLAHRKVSSQFRDDPVGKMQEDYEQLLQLLFAEQVKRDREYSRAAFSSLPIDRPPLCKLDKLLEIWKTVMPQRSLVIHDDRIDACGISGKSYEARHMSDGERVCIYLIGHSLSAPSASIIVIDEPEIHLHRAIQSVLWDRLEDARRDCTFVYITHDLEFAATRTTACKIWLKDFDGLMWSWEELPQSLEMPDSLLFQVLGSRRPILFVEGDDSSYDTAIYVALYPGDLVVSRESCKKVVDSAKSFRALSHLHHLSARGIVDRDHRGEEEVEALRGSDVLVADVAEVENLFCLPEALNEVADQLKCPDVQKMVLAAQKAVIEELRKSIEHQALARSLAQIQFRLNGFGPKVGNSDVAKLESDLKTYLSTIDVHSAVAECRKLFEDVVNANDYQSVLKLFNWKGMISSVAAVFGIKREVYCQIVLELIKSSPNGPIASAMRKAIEGS